VLAVVPLSHAGGSLFGPTIIKNGTMVVMTAFDPGEVLRVIQDYKISCTMLVPTMIYALLDHPDFDKYDLSSLETIFYGASLMSPARLKEGLERIGQGLLPILWSGRSADDRHHHAPVRT
jgi:fatty-acyl-CoA synthase